MKDKRLGKLDVLRRYRGLARDRALMALAEAQREEQQVMTDKAMVDESLDRLEQLATQSLQAGTLMDITRYLYLTGHSESLQVRSRGLATSVILRREVVVESSDAAAGAKRVLRTIDGKCDQRRQEMRAEQARAAMAEREDMWLSRHLEAKNG